MIPSSGPFYTVRFPASSSSRHVVRGRASHCNERAPSLPVSSSLHSLCLHPGNTVEPPPPPPKFTHSFRCHAPSISLRQYCARFPASFHKHVRVRLARNFPQRNFPFPLVSRLSSRSTPINNLTNLTTVAPFQRLVVAVYVTLHATNAGRNLGFTLLGELTSQHALSRSRLSDAENAGLLVA